MLAWIGFVEVHFLGWWKLTNYIKIKYFILDDILVQF